jgi:hypothetical protein
MSEPLTSTKPSIYHQIAEVRRELAMRQNVYPKLISRGKLKLGESQLCTMRLEAVLVTLEFMRDNRETIIAACFPEKAVAQ